MDFPVEVRRHYENLWGAPSRRAQFVIEGQELEVWKWAEGENPEGVTMYATVGASAFPLHPSDPQHRIELFTGLQPANDEVARSLAMAASYTRRQREAIGHGHTLTYSEPLWPGTEMRSYLVLRQLSEVIPLLLLDEGFYVEFFQVIPIYPSELAFKSAHGAETLLESWEAADVPFWDPSRSPTSV